MVARVAFWLINPKGVALDGSECGKRNPWNLLAFIPSGSLGGFG